MTVGMKKSAVLPRVADLGHFFYPDLWILFKKFGSESGSSLPQKTGSGSRSYLDMFLMFSKINNFLLWHFLTKSKQIKDKNI